MTYKQTNNTKPVYGEQSQSVLALQKELNSKGAGLKLDGKFGDLTQAAFDKFNKQAQLPSTQGTNIPIDAITNQPKPMELASNVPMNRMSQNLYQDAINANQGLISAQQQGSQQESGITDIMKALGTESQFTNKQLDEQGVTAGQKRLAELQAMAMGETNRLTSDILKNESNAIGTRETSNFLGAQEARMRRESAINSLAIASEAAIVQGQTELAQANVDRMVKAVYEPMRMEKDIALFNLQRLDKNLLEPAQKAKAEATERRLNYEAKQLDKQQAFVDSLYKNGAPPSLIAEVLKTGSLEEAMTVKGVDTYATSAAEKLDMRLKQINIDEAPLDRQIKNAQLRRINQDIAKTAQEMTDANGNTISVIPGQKPSGKPDYTAAGFANRVIESNNILNTIETDRKGILTRLAFNKRDIGKDGKPQYSSLLKSSDIKEYEQAQRNFLTAVLRKESGASISPEEMLNGQQQYFAQKGDTKDVILQKQRNRIDSANGLIGASGKAFDGTYLDKPSEYRGKSFNANVEDSYLDNVDKIMNDTTTNYSNSGYNLN